MCTRARRFLHAYIGTHARMHTHLPVQEAAFICMRTSQVVQQMTASAHADLWRSVMQHDVTRLLSLHDHLLKDLVPRRDRVPMRVPLRLLLTGVFASCRSWRGGRGVPGGKEGKPMVQTGVLV